MIKAIHHVQITVPMGAEAAARTFYCDVLGLPEVEKPESLKGRGGLWIKVGNRDVHIGTEDGFDRNRTKAHVAYEVTDVSAWRDRLKKVGIEPLDSISIEGFDRFEARDPFGNRIEFIQRLKSDAVGRNIHAETMMETTRHQRKIVHENGYAAEVEVDLIITDDGWSPYLSRDDAQKLDDVRKALRRGDLIVASKLAKVYRLTPVNAA